MAASLWAALLAIAAPAPARVHVTGPAELRAALERGVLHERPGTILTQTASTAELVFALDERSPGWALTSWASGRALETRALGADREPALRLAILLVVGRIDDRALPDAPPPAPPPPITRARAPARASTSSSSAVVAREAWRLEAGVDAAISAGSRVALSVGALRRWGAWRLGARGFLGVCCTVHEDGLEAARTSFSGQVEGGRVLYEGAADLGLTVAVGYSHEVLAVRAVDDVFAGPGGVEESVQQDLVARAAAFAEWSIPGDLRMSATIGVEAHPGVWTIRLPPPYSDGRTALERPIFAPFAAIGVGTSIF